MLNLIRSVKYHMKNGGLWQLQKKILEIIYDFISLEMKWLVYCNYNDIIDISNISKKLEIKALSFDELIVYKYFKAIYYPENIKFRFKNGELCYGFFIQGNLAHIAWLSRGYLTLSNKVPILKGKKIIGIYDCFTLPEFRNQGIYNYVLFYLVNELKEDNCFIAVDPDNTFSVKAIKNVGFECKYQIAYKRKMYLFKSFIISETSILSNQQSIIINTWNWSKYVQILK
jgi:hypothetical protein